jgi:hypothetical protein
MTEVCQKRPTLPEVRDRFKAYFARHFDWGSLHIVLDDQNVRDADVKFCIEHAREKGDQEGEDLARTLLTLSRTQRLKLAGLR